MTGMDLSLKLYLRNDILMNLSGCAAAVHFVQRVDAGAERKIIYAIPMLFAQSAASPQLGLWSLQPPLACEQPEAELVVGQA